VNSEISPDQSVALDQALAQTCGRNPDGNATLRCEDAFALAARFAVPVETIGRICNERGIKVVRCQLGCFA
jgi:hypothetical protein